MQLEPPNHNSQGDRVRSEQPTAKHLQPSTIIAQQLDAALANKDEGAFEQALMALWNWAYTTARAQIFDADAAQDLAQEAIIAVYRVAQRQHLSGADMVGLTYTKLAGRQGMPGLIKKYQAAQAGQHRVEVSISSPIETALTHPFHNQTQTLGDMLTASTSVSEDELACIGSTQQGNQLRLTEIKTQLAALYTQVNALQKQTERETVQALLAYIETCLAKAAAQSEVEFQVVLGTFKRRWRVSSEALDWLKEALSLKREAAIRDRLLRVMDLLQKYGLHKLSHRKLALAEGIASLELEAKWLWDDPTDRQTVQVLCRWFQSQLETSQNDPIRLPALLKREESQFVLDPTLSQALQTQLGLRQNTVRKRIDRVLPQLENWGLLEVMKDE